MMEKNKKNIYRLVYCSRGTVAIDHKLLHSIETISSTNNAKIGVTGFLLATYSQFFQILEGSMEAVNQVYCKIVKDSRHTDLLILSYGEVPNRLFKDWAMRGVYIGLLNKFIVDQLQTKYGQVDGDLRFPREEKLLDMFLIDLLSFLQGK